MGKTRDLRRGDVTLVQAMTEVEQLNQGKGYKWRYVYEVLNQHRRNAAITKLHDRVVAMRTKGKTSKR